MKSGVCMPWLYLPSPAQRRLMACQCPQDSLAGHPCSSAWGSIPSFQNPPPPLLHIVSSGPWVYVDFSIPWSLTTARKLGICESNPGLSASKICAFNDCIRLFHWQRTIYELPSCSWSCRLKTAFPNILQSRYGMWLISTQCDVSVNCFFFFF